MGHVKEKTCCSRQCGNTFFARKKSIETKNKIRNSLLLRFSHLEKSKGKYKFECRCCKKQFFSRTPNRKCCSKECLSKDKIFSNNASKIMIERVKNGNHKGWKNRSTDIPSYPEKFFMDVFDSRKIEYAFNLHVGKWWIDFAMKNKMIALEIDGKQHEIEKRKRMDVEKDIYLTSQGWRVHRIKWKSINNDSGKEYIKSEIDKFIKFYQGVV